MSPSFYDYEPHPSGPNDSILDTKPPDITHAGLPTLKTTLLIFGTLLVVSIIIGIPVYFMRKRAKARWERENPPPDEEKQVSPFYVGDDDESALYLDAQRDVARERERTKQQMTLVRKSPKDELRELILSGQANTCRGASHRPQSIPRSRWLKRQSVPYRYTRSSFTTHVRSASCPSRSLTKKVEATNASMPLGTTATGSSAATTERVDKREMSLLARQPSAVSDLVLVDKSDSESLNSVRTAESSFGSTETDSSRANTDGTSCQYECAASQVDDLFFRPTADAEAKQAGSDLACPDAELCKDYNVGVMRDWYDALSQQYTVDEGEEENTDEESVACIAQPSVAENIALLKDRTRVSLSNLPRSKRLSRIISRRKRFETAPLAPGVKLRMAIAEYFFTASVPTGLGAPVNRLPKVAFNIALRRPSQIKMTSGKKIAKAIEDKPITDSDKSAANKKNLTDRSPSVKTRASERRKSMISSSTLRLADRKPFGEITNFTSTSSVPTPVVVTGPPALMINGDVVNDIRTKGGLGRRSPSPPSDSTLLGPKWAPKPVYHPITIKVIVKPESPRGRDGYFPRSSRAASPDTSLEGDEEDSFAVNTYTENAFQDFVGAVEESLGYRCLFRGLARCGRKKYFVPIQHEDIFRTWVDECVGDGGKDAVIEARRRRRQ